MVSPVCKVQSKDESSFYIEPVGSVASPTRSLGGKRRSMLVNIRKNATTLVSRPKFGRFDSPASSIKIRRSRKEGSAELIKAESLPALCVQSPN